MDAVQSNTIMQVYEGRDGGEEGMGSRARVCGRKQKEQYIKTGVLGI